MFDLLDYTPKPDQPYTAIVINIFEPVSIWSDFYSGPQAINIILVVATIVGLWVLAIALDCIMKRKYKNFSREKRYEQLEERLREE